MLGDAGNKRAVRILLECILVTIYLYHPQRSCKGYVFTRVCHSVHRGRGSTCAGTSPQTRYTPNPPDQVHPPRPGTPPRQVHHPIPYQVHPPAPGTPPRPGTHTPPGPGTYPAGSGTPPGPGTPPPSRRLLLRTVRILLECILV